MTRKKVTTEVRPAETEEFTAKLPARHAFIVETNAGYVNIPDDKVVGKTEEELEEWLRTDEYFKRLHGHHILKVTHETILKITL